MISKKPVNDRHEQQNAVIVCAAFLCLALLSILVLLRWSGYEWRHSPATPAGGPGLASAPYFSAPLPMATPTMKTPGPAPEQAVDLPASPSRPLPKQSTLRATVQRYLETLQGVETRKRALLHTLFQQTPELRQVLEPRITVSPAETELDRYSVTENRFSEPRSAEYALQVSRGDAWDRLIRSLTQIVPPVGCGELHEAYIAHLKALRAATLEGGPAENASGETPSNQAARSEQTKEALGTSTRFADMALVTLCGQNGLPKTFEVSASDR